MSETGARLKDLAFQRRSDNYSEVIQLLSFLQEKRIRNQVLDSDDYEGIDIAQAYLREVPDPKKPSDKKEEI